MIDKLAEASRAGVRVRMIVRGICCLLPGIQGLTENISVVSIVGRFLEHARVYVFGSGEDAVAYIASADFMTRNTERRIEVACPIDNPVLARRISCSLERMLEDNEKAWDLLPDGSYQKRAAAAEERFNSQEYFIQEAKAARSEYIAQARRPGRLLDYLHNVGRLLGASASLDI